MSNTKKPRGFACLTPEQRRAIADGHAGLRRRLGEGAEPRPEASGEHERGEHAPSYRATLGPSTTPSASFLGS